MKKHVLLIAIMGLILALAACSGDDKSSDDETVKWVDVKLTIDPENPKPNEPVIFKAKVTYGDEVITDADNVSFEIWRAKDEKHQKIEIKEAANGVYQLEKSFDVEGTYYVIAHVTAERMHNMPKKEFVIGTPSEPEKGKAESELMDMEDDETTGTGVN